MRKLQFKTPEDFQEVFTSRKVMVTDAIVDSIEQAVMHNKKTANIFEVTFEEAEQLTSEYSIQSKSTSIPLTNKLGSC